MNCNPMRSFLRRCLLLLAVLLFASFMQPPQADASDEYRYFVDFDNITQISPDCVGWLFQPGEFFNVPVVYSESSRYYKKYRFDQVYDTMGSLHFTGDTAPDFTEPVLIMRGNNVNSNKLFGTLYKYRKEEGYYEANPTFYLLTPKGDFRLDVFAGFRTTQRDASIWVVDNSNPMNSLPEVLERSFLTPIPELLPEEGDQWIIFSAEGKSNDSTRYVIYTRCRPITYTGTETPLEVSQLEMDTRETRNGWYTVEGLGTWMIYGQNDPSWDRLIFETDTSTRRRPFGDGGCGPTSVALAIANLLDAKDLCKINDYSLDPYGYTICSCSLTKMFCHEYHVPHIIDQPDEMLKYFPLVIGNFATGNNTLEVQGRYDRFGTSMNYLPALCETVYGIHMEQIDDKETAFAFLQEGKGMAITCTGGYGSPFTSSTHFITLAGADEEYLYILDPLVRDDYGELDEDGMLEILTPGLVRMKKADAMNIMMSPVYLLYKPENQQ